MFYIINSCNVEWFVALTSFYLAGLGAVIKHNRYVCQQMWDKNDKLFYINLS